MQLDLLHEEKNLSPDAPQETPILPEQAEEAIELLARLIAKIHVSKKISGENNHGQQE